MSDEIVIFKDKKSRTIKTYVNLDGHGASMEVKKFIEFVGEMYGSPAMTLTKRAFQERLSIAADEVIKQMKDAAREVAAVSVRPLNGNTQ